MDTRTQPRAPLPAEGDVDPLAALLARPAKDLEAHGAELIAFLEQGSTASLTPHAGRLLELLEHAHFRRATSTEMTAREAIVRAVLRLGYPWALQLSAEDVGLARLEEKRQQRHGTSRVRRRVLEAVAFLGLGVASAVLLTREKPRPRPDVLLESERVLTMPTLAQVVPPSIRVQALTKAMRELVTAHREEDAVAVAFDCLADPDLAARACLDGLTAVLATDTLEQDHTDPSVKLARQVRELRWTMATGHSPEQTLDRFQELRRRWLRPEVPLVQSAEATAAAARLATVARVSLERGELDQSIREANACLNEFPDTIDCHLVLFTAHSALAARVPFEEMTPHGEAMEVQRLAIARLVSHAKRLACESGTAPTPRPLGCPPPPR